MRKIQHGISFSTTRHFAVLFLGISLAVLVGCQSTPPPHVTLLPASGAERLTPTERLINNIETANKPVAVYFYKSGCFGCTVFTPRFNKVSSEYKNRADFVMVNIAEAPNFIGLYEIRATPTVIVFADGEEKDRLVGAKSAGTFEKMLKDAM